VTHERYILQVERFDDGGKIVSVTIHVVSGRRLAGAAVTSSVMGDDTETVLCQEKHLCVPRIRIQRPAMGEGDDGASTPVFEVNLCPVFATDGVHGSASLESKRK
jgi:hypothetical protein